VADEPVPRAIALTDPKALRALAHPLRLRLVGLLRREGPLTATRAGEALGESAASCSFHLRQLAKYGLVEEAGTGKGRERPWRATAQFTSWPTPAEAPEAAEATRFLTSVVAQRYAESLQRWIDSRDETPEWQQAADVGDSFLYLTADELADLGERMRALCESYRERNDQPGLRPDGARAVTVLHVAFPYIDEHEAGGG
jgi:predicted ArsR family transcriptional regulator